MLVAGITGGASLVESARVRTVINEFRYYEQALYSFKLIKDRLPGDLNNLGKIGRGSKQVYNESDFPAPYNSKTRFFGIPEEDTAPFIDLYLNKIIEFQPKKYLRFNERLSVMNGGVPNSKTGHGVIIYTYYRTDADGHHKTSNDKNVSTYGLFSNNTIRWHSNENHRVNAAPGIFKKLDLKFDDGIYNTGIVRGQCLPDQYKHLMKMRLNVCLRFMY